MATIGAHTGADFSTATGANFRVRWDNQIELRSRNGFSNPDLRDFDERGRPEGVTLSAPRDPVGWGVLIKRAGTNKEFTFQHAGPIPINRDHYIQDGPLIDGEPGPDASKKAKIAPPNAPRVNVEARNNSGYGAGWRGFAYGWIVARDRPNGNEVRRSEYLTSPSPRVILESQTGESFRLPMPQDVPQGVIGIYIAMTPRCNTANEAATATLWIQRRIDIQDGIRITTALTGGFSREERAPLVNKTYQGAKGKWPEPRHKWIRTKGAKMGKDGFQTRLGWRYMTEFGWSLPQETTEIIEGQRFGGTRSGLMWHPARIPTNADQWQPLYQHHPSLVWYALDPMPVGRPAVINRTDPENYLEGQKPQAFEVGTADAEEDATGIPAPDSALEEPEVVGRPALPADKYSVRVVFYDEDGEATRLSAPTVQDVALGENLVVRRPAIGNLIPNADGHELDPATGRPKGWEFPAGFLGVIETPKGKVRISDSTGSTSDVDAALTPWFDAPDALRNGTIPFKARMIIRITRRVSGRFRLVVRERKNDNTIIDTTLAGVWNTVGNHEVKLSFGPVGSGKDIQINAATKEIRFIYRMVGSSVNGARNMDVSVEHLGKLEGLAAPRTFPRAGDNPDDPVQVAPEELDELEDDPFEYKRRGVATIARIPGGKRHVDLVGIDMNGFLYWAPYKTPAANDHGLTGYRKPLTKGDVKTVSAYVGWEGVSVQTDAFHIGVFDDQGRLLQDKGPLVSGMLGDLPPTRFVSEPITAGPNAAYLEIYKGGLSDGFVNAMGFQCDDGPSPTAYTNQNALGGHAILTFDTQANGVRDGSHLEFLGGVEEWIQGGATFTERPAVLGTTVDVAFRSANGLTALSSKPWIATFENTPKLRYWQIKVTLETTDPLESPLVSFVGLEVARGRSRLERSDGTEYPAPVQVVDMPVPTGERIRGMFTSDNNTRQVWVRGVRAWRAEGVTLETYSDAAVRMINSDADGLGPDEDMLHIVSDSFADRRYTVWFEGVPQWSVDREVHLESDPYYIWTADVNMLVVEQDSLVGEAVLNDR